MILIKNGRVIDPKSKLDKILDVLIENDRIVKMDNNISSDGIEKLIDAKGMTVAPGLIDVHVHFRDPGYTYKEDIFTGSIAAANGGFTTVICMANTNPAVDNEKTLEEILNKSKNSIINVLQSASITIGLKGEEIVDMKHLKNKGAVGFTDDGVPILDSRIMIKAMNTAKELNVPLSLHEEDPDLIGISGINEGIISRKLGLSGASHLAEEIMTARDCLLAIETKAKINIQHVSSGTTVDIIRYAKEKGANITAEVTPHHFSLTEEEILNKGTNAKMNPPLRTERDRLELIKALKDGVIDIIATDHAPHSYEEKSRDFDKAPSGIIGLETALALGITNLVRPGHLNITELLEKMTINPAKLYNLTSGVIKEGSKADIVIFDAEKKWTIQNFVSRSQNSPFLGQEVYGKVKYTICNGVIVYAD